MARLKRKTRKEKELESIGQPTVWRMKLAAELNRLEVESEFISYTYVLTTE